MYSNVVKIQHFQSQVLVEVKNPNLSYLIFGYCGGVLKLDSSYSGSNEVLTIGLPVMLNRTSEKNRTS